MEWNGGVEEREETSKRASIQPDGDEEKVMNGKKKRMKNVMGACYVTSLVLFLNK